MAAVAAILDLTLVHIFLIAWVSNDPMNNCVEGNRSTTKLNFHQKLKIWSKSSFRPWYEFTRILRFWDGKTYIISGLPTTRPQFGYRWKAETLSLNLMSNMNALNAAKHPGNSKHCEKARHSARFRPFFRRLFVNQVLNFDTKHTFYTRSALSQQAASNGVQHVLMTCIQDVENLIKRSIFLPFFTFFSH